MGCDIGKRLPTFWTNITSIFRMEFLRGLTVNAVILNNKSRKILYFVDRASRYKFLVITSLTHFFMYLFISCLYMFRASQRSSSGDRIVLIHHLVLLVCVNDCLVCRSGIPSSHCHFLSFNLILWNGMCNGYYEIE